MASVFSPHSAKQEKAIFSDNKITALITGIQFGKTLSGACWLKRLMYTFTEKTDAFIIAAPTYKILEQSTLPAFLSLMAGTGVYNKKDSTFRMYSGGIVYMRTGTEPDSIVGITNVRGIWADEAGKLSLYFWENLQGRSAFKNCPIFLSTSPYTLNWIYKELYKPSQDRLREDVSLITAASDENPYFPKEEFERRRKTMDPRRFAMMFGGKFDRMQGLVYDCFDEDQNVINPFALPKHTKYVAGVDWGYTEPFAIVVRAITAEGNHYQVGEFYKSGLTFSGMVEAARQKRDVFGIKMFWCDPSQPGLIAEFNNAGLPAMAADNDIMRGVHLHYELIKSRKFKIFRGTSPYTLDELDTYHYPEPDDLEPDQAAKEQKPVDQNNHALDASRYCTISEYRSTIKHRPVINDGKKKEETFDQKIKRLKTPRSDRDEDWS